MPFGSEPFSISRAVAASRRTSLESEIRNRSSLSSHHPPTEIHFLSRGCPVFVKVEHDNNFSLHVAHTPEATAAEVDSAIRAGAALREAAAMPFGAAAESASSSTLRRRGRSDTPTAVATPAVATPVLGVSMQSNSGTNPLASEKMCDDCSLDLTPRMPVSPEEMEGDLAADILPTPIEEAVPQATSHTPRQRSTPRSRTPQPCPGLASPVPPTPRSASSDFLAHASRTRALADAMLSRLKVYREEK